ncbi:MAG: hypothetical protein AB4041_03460 [Microcystaceae cyanobacterium]
MSDFTYINKLQLLSFKANLHQYFGEFILKRFPQEAESECQQIFEEIQQAWRYYKKHQSQYRLSLPQVSERLKKLLKSRLT